MSNFTPTVSKQYEFDGDTVNVVFSRLLRKDMLTVLPIFLKLNKAEEDTDEYREGINDILNALADVLPNYVSKFEGLDDAEGNPIAIDQVVNEMYFMSLCALIAIDLIQESGVPGGND